MCTSLLSNVGSETICSSRNQHYSKGATANPHQILSSHPFVLLDFVSEFVLAGNHESETMNQMYGFYGEVKSKYTANMADLFTEVYNWLPLAQVINNKIMVMHGGLFSDDNVTLDDIRKVERNRQPPDSGKLFYFYLSFKHKCTNNAVS